MQQTNPGTLLYSSSLICCKNRLTNLENSCADHLVWVVTIGILGALDIIKDRDHGELQVIRCYRDSGLKKSPNHRLTISLLLLYFTNGPKNLDHYFIGKVWENFIFCMYKRSRTLFRTFSNSFMDEKILFKIFISRLVPSIKRSQFYRYLF
jgi:hypothetical protein